MTPEVVLITGASSGLGLELARLFAADGAQLILVARSEDKLTALAAELHSRHGTKSRVIVKDLTAPDAAQQLFDEIGKDGTEVDVVVNNAAFGARGTVADLPMQRQLDMVQLNVSALARLTLLFLPGMLRRGRGGILNVGSTAGFQPGPNMAVYYATKAFVLSFTEALAEELRRARCGFRAWPLVRPGHASPPRPTWNNRTCSSSAPWMRPSWPEPVTGGSARDAFSW